MIKKGERYARFGGLWRDDYSYESQFVMYKTCLQCDEDWSYLLKIFHDNGKSDAARAYGGFLKEAIEDAYEAGYLTEDDPLVNEWLGIWPKNISSEERKIREEAREKRRATVQMMTCSKPLLQA